MPLLYCPEIYHLVPQKFIISPLFLLLYHSRSSLSHHSFCQVLYHTEVHYLTTLCCFITPEVHYLTTLSVALSPQKFIMSPLFLLLYHPRRSLSHHSFCCFITQKFIISPLFLLFYHPRRSSHHSFCCFITQKFIILPLFLLLRSSLR